jgi:site-specific recombinase XerD
MLNEMAAERTLPLVTACVVWGQQGMWDEARRWEAALGAAGELRARTVALYGQDVRRFLAWFAWYVTWHEEELRRRSGGGGAPSLDLDAVTSEEALAYRAYLLEQGLGRSSINRALTSLRLFFAMRRGHSPSPVRL